MRVLNKNTYSKGKQFDDLPERIIQFGEGNFLRGFVDWMIHQMNKKGLFQGRVVAIQPTPFGKVVPKLNAQDGLYTVALRGIDQAEVVDQTEVISSISRGINPYTNWAEVLKVAENKEVQFVFSNTTEAGLDYRKEVYDPNQSPLSFPGKLTAFLYHRYIKLGGNWKTGMMIFPCELLENNGDLLKELVLQIATDWQLPESFAQWIKQHNRFCNTLVDRIVTGFPKDSLEEFRERLGYEDQLLTVGEPYHLFAIEADMETTQAIPFHQAELNVHWDDTRLFRELKVRILNGAHTILFSVAFLSGANTVIETMKDPILREYVHRVIYDEILPAVSVEPIKKKSFADSVIERFVNPYTQHKLLDLGLNATFKYKVRVLPTLLDVTRGGEIPHLICFSLASLIAFYQGTRWDGNQMIGIRQQDEYLIRDEQETLEFFNTVWQGYEGKSEQVNQVVHTVLKNEMLWGRNLLEIPYLENSVSYSLNQIMKLGVKKAIDQLLQV